MDEMRTPTPVRRRRGAVWALFGVVGLVMGVAFATGFAQTSNTISDPSAGDATQLLGKPSAINSSQYASYVTVQSALDVGFDGNYATIASPTVLFDIKVAADDPYGTPYPGGARFYSDVVLTNWVGMHMDGSAPGPEWDTLEFEWDLEPCTGGAVTDAWAAAAQTPQMHVDRVDAHVTLTGLLPGTEYCVGLNAADAATESAALATATSGTITGTVMFRSDAEVNSAVTPVVPQFAATIGRSA